MKTGRAGRYRIFDQQQFLCRHSIFFQFYLQMLCNFLRKFSIWRNTDNCFLALRVHKQRNKQISWKSNMALVTTYNNKHNTKTPETYSLCWQASLLSELVEDDQRFPHDVYQSPPTNEKLTELFGDFCNNKIMSTNNKSKKCHVNYICIITWRPCTPIY